MARAPVYSIWILSLSLLAACTSQPREASGQDRPSIAGRDDWKTDFGKHTVPLEGVRIRWPTEGWDPLHRPTVLRQRKGSRPLA